MSIIEWTFMCALLSRMISLYRYRKNGTQSNIQISGGELSKFLITFFVLYLWNALWFTVIGYTN